MSHQYIYITRTPPTGRLLKYYRVSRANRDIVWFLGSNGYWIRSSHTLASLESIATGIERHTRPPEGVPE